MYFQGAPRSAFVLRSPAMPLPCYRRPSTVMFLPSPSAVCPAVCFSFRFCALSFFCSDSIRSDRLFLPLPFCPEMQEDPPFPLSLGGSSVSLMWILSIRNCDPSTCEHSTRRLAGYTSSASSDRIDMSSCKSCLFSSFLFGFHISSSLGTLTSIDECFEFWQYGHDLLHIFYIILNLEGNSIAQRIVTIL